MVSRLARSAFVVVVSGGLAWMTLAWAAQSFQNSSVAYLVVGELILPFLFLGAFARFVARGVSRDWTDPIGMMVVFSGWLPQGFSYRLTTPPGENVFLVAFALWALLGMSSLSLIQKRWRSASAENEPTSRSGGGTGWSKPSTHCRVCFRDDRRLSEAKTCQERRRKADALACGKPANGDLFRFSRFCKRPSRYPTKGEVGSCGSRYVGRGVGFLHFVLRNL